MQFTRTAAWLVAGILLAASPQKAPTGPVNLGFEAGHLGEPPSGWFVPRPSTAAGYKAELTADRPKSGKHCAVISAKPDANVSAGFGNLMQQFDAAPYRGKMVRYRTAVRTETSPGMGKAQLWMRVDRAGGVMGFFDNMQDRPIASPDWNFYDITGTVDSDAAVINIGLMLLGTGKVWIDEASFEVLGNVEAAVVEPARPLTSRGLQNVVAYAKLFGYVRHFHPSDEAARTDWNQFAIDGVRSVESAASAEQLVDRLRGIFTPVAPTVVVFAGSARPADPPSLTLPNNLKDLKLTRWHHAGFGTGNPGNIYHSERLTEAIVDCKGPDVYEAALGGGVTARVPLALITDAQGTLPHSPIKGEGSIRLPAPATGDDRTTRLADVILAWNVFQHFYPYFDVVQADWPGELERAVTSAATDKNAEAFLVTLERMVAALNDGHGNVFLTNGPQKYRAPLLCAWVENRLVITRVIDAQGQRIERGDLVNSIDGKPAARAISEAEALISGATPQWIRFRAVDQILLGRPDEPVSLEIEGYREPGAKQRVTLKRIPQGAEQEVRPEKVAELEPGIVYVDLDRVAEADWTAALPKLEQARGIVFDMRGYPKMGPVFLQHLTQKPLASAQWHVPIVLRPDRTKIEWEREGEWSLPPAAPYLTAKKAFLIDGRAISYAESCMGIVEAYHLAELVGGPTAGTNGNVNPLSLPGGYRVTWTGMKVIKHDGSRHHGVGIAPTVPVSRTLAGVAAGRDEILERAVQIVRN
jgi:C-terminal processing protease CtpA/Prc